jgi:hypothetical protein
VTRACILLLLAGCGKASNNVAQNTNDPEIVCSSYSGRTCLAVRVDSSNGNCPDANALFVNATSGIQLSGWTPATPGNRPNICFPVMFAVLPPATFTGSIKLHVAAINVGGGVTAGADVSFDNVAPSDHALQSAVLDFGNHDGCGQGLTTCSGTSNIFCCATSDGCCGSQCCSQQCGMAGRPCCTSGSPCSGQTCCSDNNTCVNAGTACGVDSLCAPQPSSAAVACEKCGDSYQVCCGSGDPSSGTCNAGMGCYQDPRSPNRTACAPCGTEGQLCCPNGGGTDMSRPQCAAQLSCTIGPYLDLGVSAPVCARCGWNGQDCCAGSQCPNSTQMTCGFMSTTDMGVKSYCM